MNISNSPDINNLLVDAIWDISGRYPILRLENLSTGDNLANVDYAFKITSPSGTNIWDGNTGQPDIEGIWTDFTFYSNTPDPLLSPPPTNYIVAGWPRPFNQIEWSGAPYLLTVMAIDSLGNTWELPISQLICRPSGNVTTSITTYGKGFLTLQINCDNANAYFEDITNSSYKGLAGTLESSQLKVLYPDDETDAAPTPFIINNFSTALVPITYDSNNYEFVYTSVYLYDFGNNSFVRVKYYTKERFSVNCNIDLCPLVCEYEKLLQKAAMGQCGDLVETTKKLLQINGKMNLAMIAKTQPLCGIDLPALIEEIKVLGNFVCDCCTPSGIKPFNSASLADYNFQIISGGGDISGGVGITGNNIQFTLYDKNYVFKICDTAPTSAFTVTPSTTGYTRTYCLNIDMVQFATDMLNTISGNLSLVNLFNSIVDFGSASTKLIVDGACIFQSTSSCDYTYIVANVPANTTYVLVTSLKVWGTARPLYYAFNLTNLAAFETYLNSLGFGTFVVTNLGSGNVSVDSSTNTFDLSDLTYRIASTSYIADFTKVCTGYLPMDASQVVQAIIYYLCGIDDADLVTSQAYTICYASSNLAGSPPTLINNVTIAAGTKLNVFLAALLDKNCDSVTYFAGLASTFQNGLTKTNNLVELGGTLIKSTLINTAGFQFKISNPGSTDFQVNASNVSSVVQEGSGVTSPVTVYFQRGGLVANIATTVGDRGTGSYYSAQIAAQTELGQQAYIGSYLPTTNDALLSPPPIDVNKTSFVKVSQGGVGTTGLVESYGKEQLHTGDHSTFLSFIVLKKLTGAEIAALNIALLIQGMLVFNTTTSKINVYNGAAWEAVTSL